MNKLVLSGVALLAAAVVAVLGCGSGAKPIVLETPEEYADVILCPDPTTAQLVRPENAEEAIRLARERTQTLKRVTPPPELRGFHEAYIVSFEAADLEVSREAAAEAETRLTPELSDLLLSICEPRRATERSLGYSGGYYAIPPP